MHVDQVEIKAGQAVRKELFKGLNYFLSLYKRIGCSHLVHGGRERYTREGINVTPWYAMDDING